MGIKTYTSEMPKSLISFAVKYSKKQKDDRNTVADLIRKDVSKTKQNQELQKLGYNKRQANSLLIDIEGKMSSAAPCRKAHVETLEGKIKSAQEQVEKWEKQLEKYQYLCCRVRRYILAQQRKLEELAVGPIEVNFGTEFNFPLVGSQGESNGNQICQYDAKRKQLKIRVPVEWEALTAHLSNHSTRHEEKSQPGRLVEVGTSVVTRVQKLGANPSCSPELAVEVRQEQADLSTFG